MKRAIAVFVLLVYTAIGPVIWAGAFLFTLPFVWKSVLSGKRPTMRRAPYFVPPKPQPEPASVSGNPTTSGPAPKVGPVDIAAKLEAGTMTPDDWRRVSVIHNREHRC